MLGPAKVNLEISLDLLYVFFACCPQINIKLKMSSKNSILTKTQNYFILIKMLRS